jgi:NADH-quinone oxidoreductase subunit J
LFQGAQFLGVATVVIYAGAILVTFLFVLMLAQPQGDAFYDRISWEGLLSSCTGALLTAGFTIAIVGALTDLRGPDQPTAKFIQEQLNTKILATEHVASLGGQLFSTYIIAIEIAGTLLLVGLVGAVAIVARASRFAPPTKQAPPRIDPAIVTGREPIQSMEFAGQEVSHG